MLFKLKQIFKNIYIHATSLKNSMTFCMKISWRASKPLTFVRIMLEIISSALPFMSIFLSKVILNLLVSAGGKDIDKRIVLNNFIIIIIWLMFIQFGSKILDKIKEFTSALHSDYIVNYINVLMSEKSMNLDLSFFDSPKYYNELVNANRDSNFIQNLCTSLIQLISIIVKLITSFILLSQLNVVFSIILIVTIIPSIFIEKKYTERLYNWQRNAVPEERKFRYLLGILSSKAFSKDIRIYNIGQMILNKYKLLWAEWFKTKKKIITKKTLLICTLSILPELCFIGMMYYIGRNIILGLLTIGDYNLYTGIIGEMIGGLFMLVYTFSRILDTNLRIANFDNFLKWNNEIRDGIDLLDTNDFTIEFRKVFFKYPGTTNIILNNFNLKISSKEKIALVGVNGAGKSTIIKLILRFYDPDAGEILINDVNIKAYSLNSIREKFSVMFQDYVTYAFDLEENIYLSNIKYKDDFSKINEACTKSGVDKMLSKFKFGLNTFLTREFDESGVELSGGERQKIAIARTFFRDGEIIILDEPSAALDPESEHHIFKMFNELCKGRGAIFVSHRLSNVIMADRIVVIENGKVIEDGTHHNLLKMNGKYSYLFNLQAERYIV